jgi:hypothetical protein
MSKWAPGQSGNPKGRPKTAYLEDFDQIRAKREMLGEATQILRERWQDVVNAMIDHAIEGNPQAASFITNYVLGKPKESIDLDLKPNEGLKIVITKDEESL